jgi:hypothetical protein
VGGASGDGSFVENVTSSAVNGCYASPMCILCVEFEKGRMTAKEARRALGEMVPKVGAEHAKEVERVLREAEKKAGASSRSP